MKYEKYELEVILFDNSEVFADLGFASDADEDGSGTGKNSVEDPMSDI